MNTSQIKDRLALIQAGGIDPDDNVVVGIEGIKKAYAEAPATLPESDLPIFCNFFGPTRSFTNLGGTLYQEDRIYLCRLYVVSIQAGIDGEAERKVEPFIDRCMKAFIKHNSLGDGFIDQALPGIQSFEYLGDTGITVLTFAQVQFAGVEFRVGIDAIIDQAQDAFD